MLTIYNSWDYNKALKKVATKKGSMLRSVKLSFSIDERSPYGVMAFGRKNQPRGGVDDWNSDYNHGSDPSVSREWFILREPWIKTPYFLEEWEDHHGSSQFGSNPNLTRAPDHLEFSDFEQKVENYFLKNNFTIGEIAATEDYEDYLDVAKEVAAGEFQGDVNYFMKKGANFPFNLNGMICYPMYINVCNAIMANFFDFLQTKDVNIFACEDSVEDSQLGAYKICFEDFEGTPAQLKELFNAYAEEFGLYRHFLNIFFDEDEPIEVAKEMLGISIGTENHTPSKSSASNVQQGVLKDQNDIPIEIGDIIAYPRGGDHNYYCLYYGKVIANTAKMVIMEDDQKARCDKVMVIKTNNPNKKLPWDN